jgi:hypothetical protein
LLGTTLLGWRQEAEGAGISAFSGEEDFSRLSDLPGRS